MADWGTYGAIAGGAAGLYFGNPMLGAALGSMLGGAAGGGTTQRVPSSERGRLASVLWACQSGGFGSPGCTSREVGWATSANIERKYPTAFRNWLAPLRSQQVAISRSELAQRIQLHLSRGGGGVSQSVLSAIGGGSYGGAPAYAGSTYRMRW
jgi:hypothetical protein